MKCCPRFPRYPATLAALTWTILSCGSAFAADPIVHQISLPAGMSWCDETFINGLFTQINAYRTQNGIAALKMDPLGMKDAEMRAVQFAQYMAAHPPGSPGFNPHQGYDTTAASLGYDIVSENLAYMTSDPNYIVYAVWQDTLHRAAMLASDANVAGVSCVYSNGTPYSTYEPGRAQSNPSTDTSLDSEEAAFLSLINAYRAQNGVGSLQISPTLQNASTWMSNDMATNNYASHTDSLGRSVGIRLAAFGYTYVPYGENIAGGFADAQTVLNQWINACDPDAAGNCTYAHRKAMLSAGFKAIGIGRVYNARSVYGWYWTTDFGGYVDGGPSSTAPVISSFAASPALISSGQSAVLSWTVVGATTITLDNGIGDVSTLSSKVVSPGQTTTYRLTATNAVGSSSATATVTLSPASDTQPPSVPVLNSAVATSPTQVDLNWSASTDNVGVAGYQVFRNGSLLANVAPASTTYSDRAAAAAATYVYSVRAYDGSGNYSGTSNAATVTTPAPPACSGPAQNAFTGCYYNNAGLTGTPALVRIDNQINFDWMYSTPDRVIAGPEFSARWQGAFQFEAGTYVFTVTVSDGVRLYVDGSLVLDRWRDQPVYNYTVRQALNDGAHTITMEYYERTGMPTAHLSWAPLNAPTIPAPIITSFTATPSSITAGQSATLSWAVSGATATAIDNSVGDVSGVTSKSVSPAQTTTYTLTARNSGGNATAVATVVVNPSPAPDSMPPSAPALKSAVAKTPQQVDLAWGPSSDNVGVTGYQVLRNGSLVASLGGASLSYSDVTVVANTTYSYTLRAVDGAGNRSPLSNSISVTTPVSSQSGTCEPATNAFTGCYYNNTDLSGTPVLIRTDAEINFDWMFTRPDSTVQPTNYSVRWQGNFSFDQGDYTFYATTSDGMRVYVDNVLILDRWRDQPIYIYTVHRTLSQGIHQIVVEYYERTGSSSAHLSWVKR
jgi:uncharacterized protein YkwD/chitodextrinase